VRVIVTKDCGNSPKNMFLEKLTVAFAKGGTKLILGSVADDIRWDTVGGGLVQGKDDFVEALKRMKTNQVVELTIYHVVTHGKAGAVNGTTKLKNGSTRAFCDVYEFSGAKGTTVKEITSYVIEIT